MLSLKFIRENIDKVKLTLQHKNVDFDVEPLLLQDEKRRNLIKTVEGMKSERNATTKAISDQKSNGKDATAEIKRMRTLSEKIKVLDQELKYLDDEISSKLLFIPNIYHLTFNTLNFFFNHIHKMTF